MPWICRARTTSKAVSPPPLGVVVGVNADTVSGSPATSPTSSRPRAAACRWCRRATRGRQHRRRPGAGERRPGSQPTIEEMLTVERTSRPFALAAHANRGSRRGSPPRWSRARRARGSPRIWRRSRPRRPRRQGARQGGSFDARRPGRAHHASAVIFAEGGRRSGNKLESIGLARDSRPDVVDAELVGMQAWRACRRNKIDAVRLRAVAAAVVEGRNARATCSSARMSRSAV